MTRTFLVAAGAAGQRLDAFLAASVGDELSRSRIKALIEAGCVAVNGRSVMKANRKLQDGETVVLDVPAPEAAEPIAQPLPLRIIYEDEHLIVVDKPAGLVVHPGAGNPAGTLVNALLAHCGEELSGIGGVLRPGIVHRLDKDTSGLLVVAKSDLSHRRLAEQFANHGRDGRLTRAYLALVWGKPARAKGLVDAPLGRDGADRTRRAVVPASRPDARQAVTHYEILASAAGGIVSVIRCRLETGRTHQIRVHLAHLGHPLLGDLLYGAGFRSKAGTLPSEGRAAVETFARQALHAGVLGFEHPITRQGLMFETPPPEDLLALGAALGIDLRAVSLA